jgi:tRNA threonylcarbamoyladenosine biosynthesis protein TsaE
MREIIVSEEDLDRVVGYLEESIPKDAIVFLSGDLASGKTTLAQAIAKSRGVTEAITSPTFSLQQCYEKDLYHYDLYRIEPKAFMELGLFEEFDKAGWHLVEWGDESLKSFLISAGYDLYIVTITPFEDRRKYSIKKGK